MSIQHSVCRWCFESTPLPQLAEWCRDLGITGIDLLHPHGHVTPLLQQGLSGCGGLVARALSLKQASTQLLLQGVETAQDRGVVHTQSTGGAGRS